MISDIDRGTATPIVGAGEMADAVRAFDWSQTPLAPVSAWPRSLITAVNICLNSRFPMAMWWGSDLTMIYNDAWRPVFGASKHPRALGGPGQEIWPEIWDIIGLQLNSVLETGKATWSDLLLVLDRNFYTEEAARRSSAALASNLFDIPFDLLYAAKQDGETARLIEAVGVERGLHYSPDPEKPKNIRTLESASQSPHEIVNRYGGHIWVESEPGKGATFCFTLPMLE